MSSKIDTWFKNLSNVGRIATVSAVSAFALGGIVAVSAMTTPPSSNESSQAETKKETSAPAPVVTTATETETQPILFEKQSIESNSLAKGVSRVQTAGVDGVKTITHNITFTDGVETGRVSSEANTSNPITEVTLVGIYVEPVASCDSNYSGCVPISSYDLDCSDIGTSVTVLGYDSHGFDRDGDGYGCESY